jgi:hypothetical protein
VPATPAKTNAEIRSGLDIKKPKVIAIAKTPTHHNIGVPIAKISCEQEDAPQFVGVW